MNINELSEAMWQGEVTPEGLGPMATGGLEEIVPGVAFVLSFANVSAFDTGNGLVLVDTGSIMLGRDVYRRIREWSQEPVHTAIYTHGHVDHVFGIQAFDEETSAERPRPRVIAHENVVGRFERYELTAGYNGHINARQFRLPAPVFPAEYRYPDETYRDSATIQVGELRFELHHARGETDDATWVWIPERKILCTGDLFVWVSPNCGNPQKVQRYPRDWAAALRTMETLDAELLLPGHGPPIQGTERIQRALSDTAEYLECIVEHALSGMNAGASLAEILEDLDTVIPERLYEAPYLQPVYDEPEFIVRNLWRQYGGWWEQNPAWLKPAPESALAAELAELAGGAEVLARRARSLAGRGELRLACHLAELAGAAAPDSDEVLAVRREVYESRADRERSLMSTSIFKWASRR